MLITLDHQQMLQAWRRAAGLEPSFSSCSFEAFDGIDVDDRLTTKMRQWYLRLLDTAPPGLIGPPSDASHLVTLRHTNGDRHARISLDPSVRRLVSIRLSHWLRPAGIAEAADVSARLAMQDNPFCAAGTYSPLAWRDSAGQIFISPADAGSVVSEARAVVDPGEDVYILDELALDSIPSNLSNLL